MRFRIIAKASAMAMTRVRERLRISRGLVLDLCFSLGLCLGFLEG